MNVEKFANKLTTGSISIPEGLHTQVTRVLQQASGLRSAVERIHAKLFGEVPCMVENQKPGAAYIAQDIMFVLEELDNAARCAETINTKLQ